MDRHASRHQTVEAFTKTAVGSCPLVLDLAFTRFQILDQTVSESPGLLVWDDTALTGLQGFLLTEWERDQTAWKDQLMYWFVRFLHPSKVSQSSTYPDSMRANKIVYR